MIKAALFDLDGTLLPMDEERFVHAYFGAMCRKMCPHGYEKDALIAAIWRGTGAMVKNNGAESNETVFWREFAKIFGERVFADKPLFDEFYRVEFPALSDTCGYDPAAKDKGFSHRTCHQPDFSRRRNHGKSWLGGALPCRL